MGTADHILTLVGFLYVAFENLVAAVRQYFFLPVGQGWIELGWPRKSVFQMSHAQYDVLCSHRSQIERKT